MMKKKIKECYETMKPDDAARERMLANILGASSARNATRKDTNMKKHKTNHALKFAAAFALALAIPAAAVCAAGFFRLDHVGIGKEVVGDWPGGDTREVDMISLQGLSDSPESQACAEWNEFYWEYDKDETILSQIGNGPTGVDDKYDAYTCYTQEMADKVDEICEKYQLSLMTGLQVANTYEEFLEKTGYGDIRGESDQVLHNIWDGYYYEDGTFGVDGEAIISADQKVGCKTDYQFSRAMKGTFSPIELNVEDMDAYEQWEYTTRSGETVLLAKSSFKGLILLDKEKCFLSVNVLGDIRSGTFDVSNEMLEALADSFDFAAVSG